MEQRFYNGSITPDAIGEVLINEWDNGQTVAQGFGGGDRVVVQIGQRRGGLFSDEPRQALTLDIQRQQGGVQVAMGQQQWFKQNGVQIFAGGLLGLFPLFFAFPLGHLFGGDEEIDQNLPARIWQSIDRFVSSAGGSAPATGATVRLATIPCPSCGVANPVHAEHCSACGASLTAPVQCPHCGKTNPPDARFCNQCGTAIGAALNAPQSPNPA